jgi:hypothetical protein
MEKGGMSGRLEKKLFETMSVEIVFGFRIIGKSVSFSSEQLKMSCEERVWNCKLEPFDHELKRIEMERIRYAENTK